MAGERFEANLLRFIGAELYLGLAMQTARELFGKSYFSLGVAEKKAVDDLVFGSVAANYQAITEEMLKDQKAPQPAGFQAPAPPTAPKTGQS